MRILKQVLSLADGQFFNTYLPLMKCIFRTSTDDESVPVWTRPVSSACLFKCLNSSFSCKYYQPVFWSFSLNWTKVTFYYLPVSPVPYCFLSIDQFLSTTKLSTGNFPSHSYVICNIVYGLKNFLYYFFVGLECVVYSFAYVAYSCFLRDIWIRTLRAYRHKQARYQLSTPSFSQLGTQPSVNLALIPLLRLSHPSLSNFHWLWTENIFQKLNCVDLSPWTLFGKNGGNREKGNL